MRKPVQIIGGGLAGLGLGIGLRLEGVPVTVWEAGCYPRHRVCGEVLSGRGCDVLDRIGLIEKLRQAGGQPGRSSLFFSTRRSTPIRLLPRPALCMSRFDLDDLMAK